MYLNGPERANSDICDLKQQHQGKGGKRGFITKQY